MSDLIFKKNGKGENLRRWSCDIDFTSNVKFSYHDMNDDTSFVLWNSVNKVWEPWNYSCR